VDPSPDDIDCVVPDMSQQQVRDLLGNPLKVFHDDPTGAELSWMYRDRRHSGGHTYVYFDAAGLVTRVQGSMSFGI
jgi:outer membrane protein assembly factor BamE (lipoprotein component of BamABCDE complex)